MDEKRSEGFVYSKLQRLFHFSILLALVLAGAGLAAAETDPSVDPAAASATSTTLRGHITDPTGALIPGAKIVIVNASGVPVATATADAAGAYSVSVAPGSYYVQASYDGFAPFQSALIPIEAGQVKHVHITMAIEMAQQSVVVTDDSPTVNVEAEGNSNAIVLKGKDLDALSDDPDELSNELSALAGPSAGPNGGQIYIDGFSGGQLPPKSAIREIRINQNPFSAEFDRLGYGRIEILTKPGTDKLHGQFFLQGNDKPFNTGNPFISTVPAYHSIQFNGTLNGALSKTASFFLSVESRDQQNVNAWVIPDAVLPNSSGVFIDNPDYGVTLLSPHIRNNVSARFDVQLGAKNTLTARYGFWNESEQGNLNTGSLATASTHESNTDHTVQMSDSWIINDHTVNETRFQYERQNENHYPDSTDLTVNVAGDFTGGGYSGQKSEDHATRLELWNITTMSHNKHAIKFGTRMRDTRDANLTNANFNGNFTFSQNTVGTANPTIYQASQAYENMANGLLPNGPLPNGQLGHQSFNTLVEDGFGPSSASFTTGAQSSLSNVYDVALFAQDDWKFNPRLTLSGGIRWEAQNHIADKDDWAPRLALAYALDGNGKDKKTKTVLRAGYGFFYDRLGSSSLKTINRSHVQQQFILNTPQCPQSDTTCSNATSLGAVMADLIGTASTSAAVPVSYEVAPGFHAPVTEQAGASIERQLNGGISATLTYLHSFGVHQVVTRNANQSTGGTPQTNTGGYLYEFYPEAVFKQNQLIASINAKFNKNLSLLGFYTFSTANGNGFGSASNAYNLDQDYGRASFVSRNQIFMMANYTGPWGIRFNPFLIAQSGKPFNITLDKDPINNLGNQRPTFATSSTPAGDIVQTPYGAMDKAALSGEQMIPINLGNGPAAVAVNLRMSRAFGIGPKLATANTDNAGGPPPGGPPPGGGGGGRGGGPGGGFGGFGIGGGGGGRGGMFGSASTGRKYNLNFSVQALNLFNDIDYGTPTGTLTSPSFNRSTNLAGGIFTSPGGAAARRIFAQAVFSF